VGDTSIAPLHADPCPKWALTTCPPSHQIPRSKSRALSTLLSINSGTLGTAFPILPKPTRMTTMVPTLEDLRLRAGTLKCLQRRSTGISIKHRNESIHAKFQYLASKPPTFYLFCYLGYGYVPPHHSYRRGPWGKMG
jgi:hypothetical protein